MRLILLMLCVAAAVGAQATKPAGTMTVDRVHSKLYAALASYLEPRGIWRVALFDHPPTVAEVEREAGQHPLHGKIPEGAVVMLIHAEPGLEISPAQLRNVSWRRPQQPGMAFLGLERTDPDLKLTDWRYADSRMFFSCTFKKDSSGGKGAGLGSRSGQLSFSVPVKIWHD